MPRKARVNNQMWVQGNFKFADSTFVTVTEEKPSRSDIIDYENGYGQYNNCTHVKYTLKGVSGSYILTTLDNVNEYRYTNLIPDVQLTPKVDIYNIIDAGFIGRACAQMKPGLKLQTLLPNFLLEIEEAGRLLPDIWKLASNLASLKGLRNSKNYSNGILLYSYGVAPFIGDMEALMNSYNSLYSSYEKFVNEMNVPQVSHYQEKFDISGDHFYTDWHTIGHHNYVDPCIATGTCTMGYTYNSINPLPKPDDIYFQYLGLRGSALSRIVWEAIPFSFVLDWVVHMSDLLDSLDQGTIPCTVTATSFGVSVKYKRIGNIKFQSQPWSGHKSSPDQGSIATDELTVYERRWVNPTALPFYPNLPRISGLGIRQLVLGGSLLNSNKR